MIQAVFRAGPCVSCRKLCKGIEAVAMRAPCCAVPMVQILPDIRAGQDQNRRTGAPRIRKVPFFFVVLYIHREARVRDHGPCLLLAVPAIEELVAHGRTGSVVRIVAGRRNPVDFEWKRINRSNQAIVAIRSDRDHAFVRHLRDHSRQTAIHALEIQRASLVPCVKAVLAVEIRFQLLRHCIHACINACNVWAGIFGITLIVLIVFRCGQIDIIVVCCHIVVYRDLIGLFHRIQCAGRRAQRRPHLQRTGIGDRIDHNICRIIIASAQGIFCSYGLACHKRSGCSIDIHLQFRHWYRRGHSKRHIERRSCANIRCHNIPLSAPTGIDATYAENRAL